MWQAIAKTVQGATQGIFKGASDISKGKTKRIVGLRSWAGPIIFLLTALPFIALLWGWFGSIFFKEAVYISSNAINIVKTIGPVYFFSVISILLTGTAGAAALTVNKKINSEMATKIEEQKTIQKAIDKTNIGATGFDLAFSITIGHEGGYSDDRDDKGGETYKGISRVNHRKWSGWRIIDREKTMHKKDFPEILATNEKLNDEVMAFYKESFWLRFKIDKIAEMSDKVASEVFDSCVNSGTNRIRFLQSAINQVGISRGFQSISVDCKMGNSTLSALDTILPKYEFQLLKMCNHFQSKHYLTLCENDQTQYKFLMGWLKRT